MKLMKWMMSLLFVGCTLTLTACDDDDEIAADSIELTKVTSTVADEESDAYTFTVNVNQGKDIRIYSYGFCYSETGTPTYHDATVTGIPENGKLTLTLDDVKVGGHYYVRAFAAIYPTGVVYSDTYEVGTAAADESTDSTTESTGSAE
jgi:hypothetical protein